MSQGSSEYTAESAGLVDNPEATGYRLAQCFAHCSRTAITRSATWAMRATTGPVEVRANSKG